MRCFFNKVLFSNCEFSELFCGNWLVLECGFFPFSMYFSFLRLWARKYFPRIPTCRVVTSDQQPISSFHLKESLKNALKLLWNCSESTQKISLELLWSCSQIVLKSNCTRTARKLPWKALELPRNCSDTVLELLWNRTWFTLELPWNWTWTVRKVLWNESQFSSRIAPSCSEIALELLLICTEIAFQLNLNCSKSALKRIPDQLSNRSETARKSLLNCS